MLSTAAAAASIKTQREREIFKSRRSGSSTLLLPPLSPSLPPSLRGHYRSHKSLHPTGPSLYSLFTLRATAEGRRRKRKRGRREWGEKVTPDTAAVALEMVFEFNHGADFCKLSLVARKPTSHRGLLLLLLSYANVVSKRARSSIGGDGERAA